MGPMGHDHGHSHGPALDADRKWLTVALVLIASFMAVEVVVGFIASSLALLSDAAHMLTDAGAIALALVAVRLAARPPSRRYTFGLGRAEILSAQANGATLLVLAGVLAFEAIRRLFEPADVEGGLVIVVGALGAVVNVAAAFALSRSERRGLNVEGAIAHVLADLYGSVAAVIAGVIIVTTGFSQADGIAALLVSALMLRSGWRLLRDSGRILLEGSPKGIDPDAGRPRPGRGRRRHRGPRPARVGGHLGLPGAVGARARRRGRRLPRAPRRARAAAARALRDRPHDAAGRSRARAAAARHRPGARALVSHIPVWTERARSAALTASMSGSCVDRGLAGARILGQS